MRTIAELVDDFAKEHGTDTLAARLREVWPGNLHDCKTAVRFLRKNADKYAIDAEHIVAIGGSAGGHLVAMMAVTDADETRPSGQRTLTDLGRLFLWANDSGRSD